MLLFSTYFGGTVTQIQGTAIDTSGNVYITGWAYDECPSGCAPFPATSGSTYSGAGDAFISELSADWQHDFVRYPDRWNQSMKPRASR